MFGFSLYILNTKGEKHLNIKRIKERDFPGGLMAKTTGFQCRGPTFDLWSGNWILHATANTQCSHLSKYL